MKNQNFKNHAKLVTGFHGVLFVALVALLVGSVYHLFRTTSENLYLASLSSIKSWKGDYYRV